MPYGTRLIHYNILEKQGLKSHYITVDGQSGVVLKGKPVSPDVADRLILKKASWIIGKLESVTLIIETEIVTGSRIHYLGKSYYAEVISNDEVSNVTIEFNYSKFRIFTNNIAAQEEIKAALEEFFKEKAVTKVTPRVNKIAAKWGLPYKQLSFRKLSKRWGSCTVDNRIILNVDAIKLPYSLIDYLIIHELCHTVVKDHSKAFWAELSKYEPKWRELDERMKEMKM